MNNRLPIKPVCPYCKSDNVFADAFATWDIDSQEWEVSNVFDSGHNCEDCGKELRRLEWVAATEEVQS